MNGALNEFLDMILGGDSGNLAYNWETALMVLLVAFCIGHIIAWVYIWTHTGLSYSQMFTASLLVLPVIVSMVMLLMQASIAVAFGMFAVFAVVRFRNVLKDTRDTVYILWGIVEGVGCGTQRFSTALIGCIFVGLIFAYMRLTSFGGRHRYDVILTLQWQGGLEKLMDLRPVFHRHAVRAQLASQRDLDEHNMDLSYRLQLRDPNRTRELMRELQEVPGVARVSLYHRADESEI